LPEEAFRHHLAAADKIDPVNSNQKPEPQFLWHFCFQFSRDHADQRIFNSKADAEDEASCIESEPDFRGLELTRKATPVMHR
jgi:hypothetical protein